MTLKVNKFKQNDIETKIKYLFKLKFNRNKITVIIDMH